MYHSWGWSSSTISNRKKWVISYHFSKYRGNLKYIRKISELVPNVNLSTKENASVAVLLDADDKNPVYKKYESFNVGGLANLLISNGTAYVTI